jgi:predicted AlkP superfamily phosphohydrolase/phosphomutase
MGDVVKRTDSRSRVLMLGIDAMSLPFARAHLGQLPALQSLLKHGVLIATETSGSHFSGSPWASFTSGKDVGEHGIYFPFQWDAKHRKQRRHRDAAWHEQFEFEPFWYEFSRAGISCTVLDPGCVLNSRAAPCRQITNWSYQETSRAEASDPALLAEVHHRFGRRPIGRDVPVPKKRALCKKIRDQLIEALERKSDAILWLMSRYEWQFFLAGFYEVHRGGHILWPTEGEFGSEADPNALLEVYKAADRQIQRIVEHALDERTTLILFALHGMGPNAAQDHFLPKIMSKLNALYLTELGIADVPAKAQSFVSLLRKAVPYKLQVLLAELLGENVQDWVVNRSIVGGHDWSRTPAFVVSTEGVGYLRLNIKGREAEGFFEAKSKELDHYIAWLQDALLAIRVVGTDEPLVKSVSYTRDLFVGPRGHLLPDILLKWGPGAPVEHIVSDKIGQIHERLRTGRAGNHTGESFVLVTGEGASNSAVREIAHIKDIGRFARACLASNVRGPAEPSSVGQQLAS